MTNPLLSIVIANFNYGRFLECAISSIVEQDLGGRVELIICDGGSTDDSVDIIKRYANKISWWCSEKDGGQSSAFNKGFSHAKGKFLTWLNADDVLLPGALAAFERACQKHPDGEWFGGGCVQVDPSLRVFKCDRARNISRIRASYGYVGVTGPSSFFSRELYRQVGGIDERFQYMMDTDLWVRFAVQAKARYRPVAPYIWGLRLHSDAKMSGHKFTKDGKILQGKDSRIAYEKDCKRMAQLKKERHWIRDGLVGSEAEMPKAVRFLTTSFAAAFLSRCDTLRWRNRYCYDIFKR